ncbi:hypothetical protein N7530_000508 [Penicillium desertorum]|uniref:Uncharacterized protein n=1 Tax=Penicillium desertorum TaxID=1303715 RepID=A0A9X0BVF9_9EURO|nr:hypothetical protein N7530_000508 [Penicillium desertorum]
MEAVVYVTSKRFPSPQRWKFPPAGCILYEDGFEGSHDIEVDGTTIFQRAPSTATSFMCTSQATVPAGRVSGSPRLPHLMSSIPGDPLDERERDRTWKVQYLSGAFLGPKPPDLSEPWVIMNNQIRHKLIVILMA